MKVIDLKDFRTKKELEKFTDALFHQCLKLKQENEDLKEKLEELKMLLERALLSYKDDL